MSEAEPGRAKPSRAAVEAPVCEPEPEILDEAAIVDDETALDRPSIDVMGIPRLIGGALSDIRTIAEGMAVLPKLLLSLDSIHAKVESLDDEVRKMRAAVESMGGDVGELERTMARVEPHLEDVSRVAHPLRRLSGRARRQQ